MIATCHLLSELMLTDLLTKAFDVTSLSAHRELMRVGQKHAKMDKAEVMEELLK